jgi:hypothetical protein
MDVFKIFHYILLCPKHFIENTENENPCEQEDKERNDISNTNHDQHCQLTKCLINPYQNHELWNNQNCNGEIEQDTTS